MSELVTYTLNDNVAVIKMDDGKANAVSFDLVTALNSALDQAEADKAVVVFTGREGKFCAGFDLETMKAGGEAKDRLMAEGFKLAYRLLNFPYPVLIANSGHALAMGGILLLAADYRISENTKSKIGLNEIAIGVEMPPFGVDVVKNRVAVPYQIPSLANSVLYGPEDALKAGYLDEICADGTLMDHALKLAGMLSGIDMDAHAKAKRALRADLLAKYKDQFAA